MVWGCLSGYGTGNLVKTPTKMDAKLYVTILSDNLLKSVTDLGIKDNFIFQSDNDPKHISNTAKEQLAKNHIECHEWPAQSPDLNIIEHLWEYLDRNIPKNKRSKISEFFEALHTTWKNTPKEFIDNLINSIPNRLQAVIDAKGGNTSYQTILLCLLSTDYLILFETLT